jgi:hypothetical protein
MILHYELRMMVNTRKDPSSGECSHAAVSVPPWNENSLLGLTEIVVPFDGDSMSGILTGNASKGWETLATYTL